MKTELKGVDCLTPVFRASYLNVFEPRAADPGKPNDKQYGCEMWFRVKHTTESEQAGEEIVSIDSLKAAARVACEEAWGIDRAKWPKNYKHPFKIGELNTGKNGPIPGVIMVRTNRKEKLGRPVVVTQNPKVEVLDPKTVYSGCYMRAKLHAYVWKHATGGAGVSFTLDMVQLVRDGEPLGNFMKAEDAFDTIEVPVGAAQASAPAAASQSAPAADPFGGA